MAKLWSACAKWSRPKRLRGARRGRSSPSSVTVIGTATGCSGRRRSSPLPIKLRFNSPVVFWVVRGKPSPCQNHRLLGEQRGEEIFRPLPEFEALVGIQDQPLNECLRLLTTRFPNGFDGYAPFCR